MGASTAALALLAAGCGDDEPSGGTSAGTATAETAPPPRAPPARTAPAGGEPATTAPDAGGKAPRSPEEQPGGAGDDIPARSQALLTGRAGTIRPRRVEVPPFIAVRVELRSADGRHYSLRFGRTRLAVGGGVRSRSRTFEGLRPGEQLVGVGGGRVVIAASAEPGP